MRSSPPPSPSPSGGGDSFQGRNSYQDSRDLRTFKLEIPNPANPFILIILIQTLLGKGPVGGGRIGLDARSGAKHNGLQDPILPRGVVVARQPLELESLVRAQAGQPLFSQQGSLVFRSRTAKSVHGELVEPRTDGPSTSSGPTDWATTKGPSLLLLQLDLLQQALYFVR